MATRHAALLSLLLALLPASGRTQILGRSEFLFTGILDRFPQRDGQLALRARDGELYTVRAQSARVEVGNRGSGSWENLRPGVILDVYGEWRARPEAVATRLQIVGGETGVPPREAIREWREGGRRVVTGRVTAVDRARESLRVRVGDEIVPVEAFDRTRFLRGGQRVSLRDVRVGDRVRARGEARSGRLVAEEILLQDGGTPASGRLIELDGVVRRPPRYPRRTLALRVGEREVDVEVPEDVPVVWHSRRLLLHALEPGDRVRVEGQRDSAGRFRAARVTVISRAMGKLSRH